MMHPPSPEVVRTDAPFSAPRAQRRFRLLALSCLLFLASQATSAADSAEPPAGRTAVARQAMEWGADGKPSKLEFDFGDFKAWGRRDGSWNIEGRVQHRGLLCGTYTLKVRVGHGNPGCTDVEWFGPPRAVASTTLCNNALGSLSGGDMKFNNAHRFDEITCAERTISCTDNCK